jgi:hypothetical protein
MPSSKPINRPTSGKLLVPYMVDERINPIDFKITHHGHINKCSRDRLCGICGKRIANNTPIAFIGPDDGRRCFADPWMHPACARIAMEQCPFLADRKGWREHNANQFMASLEDRYEHNMALFIAPNGRSHRDEHGTYHFEALGVLRRG